MPRALLTHCKPGRVTAGRRCAADASLRLGWAIGLLAIGVLGAFFLFQKPSPPVAKENPPAHTSSPPVTGPLLAAPPLPRPPLLLTSPAPAVLAAGTNLSEMEVNRAVMVTVDLDFGGKVPSIAEALPQIERRHQPEDGRGRTFAILDAYGGPTPEGKLRVSMHVSCEKPGKGALLFRPTGEVLWESRIVAGTNKAAFTGQNLLILLDDGAGKTFTVDGSRGPSSILDAMIKEKAIPVAEFWPDGAEREVTFLYSACGCPVKVLATRVGERTARSKELPVIFPDDPAVVQLINHLMRW